MQIYSAAHEAGVGKNLAETADLLKIRFNAEQEKLLQEFIVELS